MKLSELKSQIEELDAKATGGPWVAVKHGDSAFGPLYQTMKEEEGYRWAINGFHGDMSGEDALFCALSRTAMPELLRRLLVAEEAVGDAINYSYYDRVDDQLSEKAKVLLTKLHAALATIRGE